VDPSDDADLPLTPEDRKHIENITGSPYRVARYLLRRGYNLSESELQKEFSLTRGKAREMLKKIRQEKFFNQIATTEQPETTKGQPNTTTPKKPRKPRA
jgi:hypothetical protein